MDSPKAVDIDALSSACLSRDDDTLFSLDGERREAFVDICGGKTVLVTGAAGFIARATLEHILGAAPRILYLLDSSENGLADLARQLATRTDLPADIDIRLRFVDIASPLLDASIESDSEVDVALHFAAAKHVRSERDVASALRLLQVNVLGTENLLRLLETRGEKNARVFAVSTDKAAEPTSLMGASKLAMEALLWRYPGEAMSARFANVLFSHGSLTEAWISRLSRGEPLSSPVGAYRYFISRREAGGLCANALVARSGCIAIPSQGSLTPVSLEDLLERFLHEFQLSAQRVALSDYELSPDLVQRSSRSGGLYPVVLTPLDTVGEKVQEVFTAPDEPVKQWAADLDLVPGTVLPGIEDLAAEIRQWISHPDRSRGLDGIRSLMRDALPNYKSNDAPVSLDHRI